MRSFILKIRKKPTTNVDFIFVFSVILATWEKKITTRTIQPNQFTEFHSESLLTCNDLSFLSKFLKTKSSPSLIFN